MTTEKLQTKTGPLVFVGIPAFNVEESIAKVVVNAKKHCDEVLVCDDGSSDDTGEIARKLGCRVIRHPKNKGYGSAIRSLLDAARESGADVLVTIDGDGQHNSKEISGLVAPIMKGEADVVIGTRFGPNSDGGNIPSTRRLGIKAITWLVDSLTDQQITDAQSGFRAYNKRALEALHPGEQGMGASTEILFGAKTNGLRVLEIPTVITYLKGKGSTLNPVVHFSDVVASTFKVAIIRHPLKYFGLPGLLLLAGSFAFGLWDLDIYSRQGRLVTNLTLISIGMAVMGVILFAAGMILFAVITVLREHQEF